MSSDGQGNGAHNPTNSHDVHVIEKWQVVLTYDTGTHHLDCGGKVPTLDVYLFLLEMAHRKIEAEIRFTEAQARLASPRAALPGELQSILNGKR